jgi:hypothetical protein
MEIMVKYCYIPPERLREWIALNVSKDAEKPEVTSLSGQSVKQCCHIENWIL